jgi:3-deoxy-7-phosphoheptulonate synthase
MEHGMQHCEFSRCSRRSSPARSRRHRAVRRLPPLVTHEEVDRLRRQLAEVAEGKRFLLQGGDCAERFLDCASEPIEKKLRILLQMSLVLTWGARTPTLRIARMAGQFAKPRSKDTEVVDGRELPAFRGDNVNSFDTSARDADPARMVSGYFHSAATLNYARALLNGGLADLHQATHWDLGFVQVRRRLRQWCREHFLGRSSDSVPPSMAWSLRNLNLSILCAAACRTRRTGGSTRRWRTASSRRWTL